MPFPPNYRQERSNRDKAKQRKAQEKLDKREEKSSQRKEVPAEPGAAAQTQDKDT